MSDAAVLCSASFCSVRAQAVVYLRPGHTLLLPVHWVDELI